MCSRIRLDLLGLGIKDQEDVKNKPIWVFNLKIVFLLLLQWPHLVVTLGIPVALLVFM